MAFEWHFLEIHNIYYFCESTTFWK